MKKKLIMVCFLFLTLLVSCNKGKSITSPKNEETNNILTTKEFREVKWGGLEDTSSKPSFEKKDINSPKEFHVIDAYHIDGRTIVVTENIKGDISFFNISGEKFSITPLNEEEVFGNFINDKVLEKEVWGFQKLNNYHLITQDNITHIYRDGIRIASTNGIAKIQDLDGDGVYEVICNKDGKTLDLFQLKGNDLVKLWSYNETNLSFSGNIQIGDLNGDGVMEFYIGITNGNMMKFVLTPNGIESDSNLPILAEFHGSCEYFFTDYNNDGSCDIIVWISDLKPQIYMNKK